MKSYYEDVYSQVQEDKSNPFKGLEKELAPGVVVKIFVGIGNREQKSMIEKFRLIEVLRDSNHAGSTKESKEMQLWRGEDLSNGFIIDMWVHKNNIVD